MGTFRVQRLELFSDGVFAIMLTLLVLDLKVPEQLGLAGLRTAAPGLLVHAGAFFVIGMMWIGHHQWLEHVQRISTEILGFNLFGLFWVTLLPYGARIAAERPHDGLGAAIMTAGVSLALTSTMVMNGLGRYESVALDPIMRPFRRRRRLFFIGYIALGFLAARLCFVSPWFGFGFLSTTIINLFITPLSVVHARLTAEKVA